ncbi:MAG: protein-disulfide reductase DsbD domain-containing protein [Pseudomonadota bacterium]
MKHPSILLLAGLLGFAAAPPTAADPFADVVSLDIIPGWQTPQGTHMTALRVTLKPGWKTYWRTPGDAGIPPQFDWTGSNNITAAQFHWPVPDVLDQNGMQTIGYEDSLLLPIELSPAKPGASITMAGEVTFGVCDDICIPVTLPFAAELPPDGRRDGAITASLINQPVAGADAGVASASCTIAPARDGLEVTASMPMPNLGPVEAVVIEAGNPEVWVSQSDVTYSAGALSATVDMVHVTASSFALDRSAVRITLFGDGYAVDVQGCSAG